MYRIPLFDLNYDQDELRAVQSVLKSKWISMGEVTNSFESKFANFLKVKNAVAVSSGTAALHLALRALGIRENDEVICPSLTFVATANVIKYVGAKPVFCDVKSYEDLTIDPECIRERVTEKTRAIIVMHYGGFGCDMDAIAKVANEFNLKIIEDAAHAPGSLYKGRNLGTIGDVGCFSFFSNKNISTAEGGMVVTNNNEVAQKIKLLRSHGMTTMSYQRAKGHATSYDVVDLGYNYRIDDIRAAIGIIQLDKLKNDIEKRAWVRKWYIEYLSQVNGIIIPFKENKEYVTNYIFPIVLKNSTARKRDYIRKKLSENGVQTSVHYPAVHEFSIYRDTVNYKLPITEYISQNLITLPMFAKLKKDNVKFITRLLKEHR